MIVHVKHPGLLEDIVSKIDEEEQGKSLDFLLKYIKWGEYLRIDVNLETGEIKVLENE